MPEMVAAAAGRMSWSRLPPNGRVSSARAARGPATPLSAHSVPPPLVGYPFPRLLLAGVEEAPTNRHHRWEFGRDARDGCSCGRPDVLVEVADQSVDLFSHGCQLLGDPLVGLLRVNLVPGPLL